MDINKLIEITSYTGDGYKPLVDYDAWRVAILKYCDELLPENIDNMQKHCETDEVFVLLQGRCILFATSGVDEVTTIEAVDMEPLKLYNVKRGVFHTHTLSEDAVVLIVENRDTGDENSPKVMLGEGHRREIVRLSRELWG